MDYGKAHPGNKKYILITIKLHKKVNSELSINMRQVSELYTKEADFFK